MKMRRRVMYIDTTEFNNLIKPSVLSFNSFSWSYCDYNYPNFGFRLTRYQLSSITLRRWHTQDKLFFFLCGRFVFSFPLDMLYCVCVFWQMREKLQCGHCFALVFLLTLN